jgi:hypothetical protein
MTEKQVNCWGRRGSVLHSRENFSPFLTEPGKGGGEDLGEFAFIILSYFQWEMALCKQVSKKLECGLLTSLKINCFLYTYNPLPKHFIIENFSKQASDKMGQCCVTFVLKY